MKLAHYTTISTLALILKNKTIRFTRLDCLDDFNEIGIYNSYATKFYYVSCWTTPETESISQWNIYGDNKRGVVIILDSEHLLISTKKNPVPIEFIKKVDLAQIVVPNIESYNEPLKVEYLNEKELRESASKILKVNEFSGISISGTLGKIKSSDWSFQNEYRFIIQAHQLKEPMKSNEDFVCEFLYYDVKLRPEFEKDLEIIIGPMCSESDIEIIDALANKYGLEKIKQSKYRGILIK